MQFEQPLPFYMAYPFLFPTDQEREQQKDLQVMKSFYSRRAAKIQEKAERECDRMEYDGSMMFDEYPDKFMMEHLCRKIEREILAEDAKEDIAKQSKEEGSTGGCRNCPEEEGLRDLIGVVLFNEMFRRRSRHRQRKRFY